MRVLVCVKRVPAPGAKINITDDGQSVDATNLGHTMSPHEECGLELAVQLVEAHGGESHVLTHRSASTRPRLSTPEPKAGIRSEQHRQ
jgi:electron transfer flavoprotein beta subunit